jgi:diadenylate cyclase
MSHLWAGLRLRDLLDVAIVAFVLYRVLLVFRGTVAIQMLAGLGLLMGARLAARQARPPEPVIRARELLGVLGARAHRPLPAGAAPGTGPGGAQPLLQRVAGQAGAARRQLLDEVVRAVDVLAVKRIGALIAGGAPGGAARLRGARACPWRRSSRPSFLGSLFQPGLAAPRRRRAHPGDRITGRRLLPARVPQPRALPHSRTRHRAAVGLSEETDAAVVVVFRGDRRGSRLPVDGVIERGLDPERLLRKA